MPGQPDAHWIIRDVEPGRGYTIEGAFLEGTLLVVRWQFDACSQHTARLTQRMELLGDQAGAHVESVRSAFEPNLEPGMRRIARAIERRHGGAV